MGIITLNSDKEQLTAEQTVEDTIVEEQAVVDPEIGSDKENVQVTLDGPLSSIYTKALNLVYANENIGDMVISAYDDEEAEEEITDDNLEQAKDKNGKDLYVYCCDNEISNEDFLEAVDKLHKVSKDKRYSEAMIALECNAKTPSNRLSLIDRLSNELGIRVVYSRDKAMDVISHTRRTK
jgi:hypothetical protein